MDPVAIPPVQQPRTAKTYPPLRLTNKERCSLVTRRGLGISLGITLATMALVGSTFVQKLSLISTVTRITDLIPVIKQGVAGDPFPLAVD